MFTVLLCGVAAMAGQRRDSDENKLRFEYDINFEMNFDNREFYESNFSNSMTIFGARLAPSVGLKTTQKEGTVHWIMLGLDVMKDFGSGGDGISVMKELTMYYRMDRKFGKTDMTLHAGIFPRSNMEGRYSQAFFSDSLKFYDNNLEGILIRFRRPNARFEIGCDWMGQYGADRRERFMVFTSGEGIVAPLLSFGYSGYMYHFANSMQVKGLVDNILVNPYARIDLSRKLPLQTFDITLGWLQAFQHNRKHVGYYVFPCGGHLDIEVSKWNVAVRNMAFYGTDMMPYYNYKDEGGFKYGNELYLGDPFYRIHDDNTSGTGLYDRLEVCYEPSLGRYVRIKVAAIFHFHDFHYSGCQQKVGIIASF